GLQLCTQMYRFVVWSLMSLFTSLNDFTRLAWCPKLSGRIRMLDVCDAMVDEKNPLDIQLPAHIAEVIEAVS
ncbi:hypothetical protein, partial [Shewanella algae]|uniref:hypothetical protein n=1 Tax=Shewanella algae TaxID=38313 RepID=UPI001C5822F6